MKISGEARKLLIKSVNELNEEASSLPTTFAHNATGIDDFYGVDCPNKEEFRYAVVYEERDPALPSIIDAYNANPAYQVWKQVSDFVFIVRCRRSWFEGKEYAERDQYNSMMAPGKRVEDGVVKEDSFKSASLEEIGVDLSQMDG